MSKINIVGHCYRPSSNSDKIYMCCIRAVGGKFTVLAKWGRRGKNLSVQDKGSFGNLQAAEIAQASLWKAKVNEGYLEIETPAYLMHITKENGPVVSSASPGIVNNLEKDGTNVSPGQPAPFDPVASVQKVQWECEACGKKYNPLLSKDGKIPEPGQSCICDSCIKAAKDMADKRLRMGEDEVLVCVDNTGMEDRFDIGIEYIVEEHKDQTMIYVYDKMGRKDEYFRTRFMTQEMWDRKNGVFKVVTVKNRDPQALDVNGKEISGKEFNGQAAFTGAKVSGGIMNVDGELIEVKSVGKSSMMPVRE